MKQGDRILSVAVLVALGTALAGWALDLGAQAAKQIRYPEYDTSGQLKFEVLGDEARVLADGRISIVNLKIIFYEEGRVMMEVSAPDCLLDRVNRLASSTSEVCVARAEVVLTGRGYDFTWENNLGNLKIRDQAKVVLKRGLTP